jgi:hypothetical protein
MTITLTREEAQQAIALLDASWEYVHSTALNTQIREFLAEVKSRCPRCGKVNPAEIHTCSPQQQKPVAWLDSLDRSQPHAVTGFQYLTVSQIERGDQHKYIPVYAAPQREWVGLTDEPAAWADRHDIEREGHDFYVNRQQPAKNGVPLYTAPPQREWQGLTDEDVDEAAKERWVAKQSFEAGAWWANERLKDKNT